MKSNTYSKSSPNREEKEIKDPSKDEYKGHRNPKKRKKEYDRKNSDDYGNWN